MQSVLKEKLALGIAKLKQSLATSRRVTICLDGWTKKGLSSSFLGISACWFDTVSDKPQHALLDLNMIQHPHTGVMLCECLAKCLEKWEIPKEKVMLIISDNGSNMVKAIRLLREKAAQEDLEEIVMNMEEDIEDESGEDEEMDDELESDLGYTVTMLEDDLVSYRRLGCLAHTLQLLIKDAYEGVYKDVLSKARSMVGKVRKSSVALERIASVCGKTVISDNTTRWNSTYLMAKRLLELKLDLNNLLLGLKMNSLLTSEWDQLEEIVALLEPFKIQTDILQSDALSLSYVIPSLLELECHLEQFPEQYASSQMIVEEMKRSLRRRFAILLQPDDEIIDFNPLPAAACLLDPTCATVILGFDHTTLRDRAKSYILAEVCNFFCFGFLLILVGYP
jgi:hypothetical protein